MVGRNNIYADLGIHLMHFMYAVPSWMETIKKEIDKTFELVYS